MTAMALTVEEMYGDPGLDEAQIEAALQRSLDPRRPEMLYDKMGELGLDQRHEVLDIGSRDARHACVLAERYGCRVLAVEPVGHQVKLATALIAGRGLTGQVRTEQGGIEAIPAAAESVDFVWCRDMLNHVHDLAAGLAECRRVLKPGGQMLVYQTFATPLLEPNERQRLFAPLAIVAANMEPTFFEQCAAGVELTIVERDRIASEWREWWEEHGERTTSHQLLTIARLRRAHTRLRHELGALNYEIELANCHWGVYQMLGKLEPTLYILRKRNV
jgi:SAM-dependent methyltransferase